MNYRKSRGEQIFDVFNHSFLFIFMLATLYPFIHVLFTSISDPAWIGNYFGWMFYPRGFSIGAYKKIFESPEIVRSILNSVIYVVGSTALQIILTVMGGFVLSKKDLPFKGVILVFLVIPMYVSGGLIASYLWMGQIGLTNTMWIMILGAPSSYSIILVRANIQSVPAEIEESATIDGAQSMTIIIRIIIPLILPIIAMIALWSAVGTWNSWLQPLIYLRDKNLYPLTVILRNMMVETSARPNMPLNDINEEILSTFMETMKHAIAIVSLIPVVAVYPFLQKYFTKGILVGAIKG